MRIIVLGGRWSGGSVCVRTMCVQCRAPPRTLFFKILCHLCSLRVVSGYTVPLCGLAVGTVYPPVWTRAGCSIPSNAD